LNEDNSYLRQLREKDNIENFEYSKEGAEEGNKYSMKKLAEYYSNGIGCEKNIEQAEMWTKKAEER
jgi:TPR repeat protein